MADIDNKSAQLEVKQQQRAAHERKRAHPAPDDLPHDTLGERGRALTHHSDLARCLFIGLEAPHGGPGGSASQSSSVEPPHSCTPPHSWCSYSPYLLSSVARMACPSEREGRQRFGQHPTCAVCGRRP